MEPACHGKPTQKAAALPSTPRYPHWLRGWHRFGWSLGLLTVPVICCCVILQGPQGTLQPVPHHLKPWYQVRHCLLLSFSMAAICEYGLDCAGCWAAGVDNRAGGLGSLAGGVARLAMEFNTATGELRVTCN